MLLSMEIDGLWRLDVELLKYTAVSRVLSLLRDLVACRIKPRGQSVIATDFL